MGNVYYCKRENKNIICERIEAFINLTCNREYYLKVLKEIGYKPYVKQGYWYIKRRDIKDDKELGNLLDKAYTEADLYHYTLLRNLIVKVGKKITVDKLNYHIVNDRLEVKYYDNSRD